MGPASESFAEYLATLDEPSLAALLARRSDVLHDPVPRGFGQLAQRLSGLNALARATVLLDRDTAVLSELVALLGEQATVAAVVDLTDVSEVVVLRCVDELCNRGMAWTTSSGVVRLVEPLAATWTVRFDSFRTFRQLAHLAVVDELRTTAAALGLAVAGLTKTALTVGVAEALADSRALAERIVRLPASERRRLLAAAASYGDDEYYEDYDGDDYDDDDGDLDRGFSVGPGVGGGFVLRAPSSARRSPDPLQSLVGSGLAVRVHGLAEIPREVAVAARLTDSRLVLHGPPDLPPSGADPAMVRTGAQAAAQAAVRAVTTLLDEAATSPIAELKKGGIGPRERSRLARRLSLPEAEVTLWLDVAFVAGLLNSIDAGYVPTPDYSAWREAEPALRWTTLAVGWFALDFAPTSREIGDGQQAPPPVPLASSAGRIRRAVLTAARGGRSVTAAGANTGWFVPLHGYPSALAATKVAAAVREAELLGVVAADTLTEFGEHLTALADDNVPSPEDDLDVMLELVRRCGPLLPVTGSSVVVQSDLTAVVAGQPSASTARLLADAAVVESRGGAQTWRFTPASVRAALDAGWGADDLLGQLRAVAEHALPQALEYLVGDVARRHGQVRVREVRCCVVADEALATEILHTRSLAKLHLRQLAPTVLASPVEPAAVLAKLRDAGMLPVAENPDGTVAVERRAVHRAPEQRRPTHDSAKARPRLAPTELARRLVADPTGARAAAAVESKTLRQLTELNRVLDSSELELLADALDRQRDVTIDYVDRNGTRTVRRIRPEQLFGKWIDAFCYLRNDQREFTVANIESVGVGS